MARTETQEKRERKSTSTKAPSQGPRPEPLYQFFTPCPQEWFILVVRGGDLHRIIHSITGYTVDENFEFKKLPDKKADPRSLVRSVFGRDFVGIPGIQGMYVYKFAWNKHWREEKDGKDSPEYGVIAHDAENVYITPFEAQYPLVYGGVEVIAKKRDNSEEEAIIPVTFVINVRVRMLRPKVALMTNSDWFGNVLTPNIQAGVKDFAGGRNYGDLIKKSTLRGKSTDERAQEKSISDQFNEYFMGTTETPSKLRAKIFDEAGVEIVSIGVTEIKPNTDFEKALIELAEAERKAQQDIVEAEGRSRAAVIDSEGQAQAIKNLADAEAERIEKTTLKVARAGENAVQVEKWKAINGKDSKLTTYVEGGTQAGILVGTDGKAVKS